MKDSTQFVVRCVILALIVRNIVKYVYNRANCVEIVQTDAYVSAICAQIVYLCAKIGLGYTENPFFLAKKEAKKQPFGLTFCLCLPF